jgi:hypothetical protein
VDGISCDIVGGSLLVADVQYVRLRVGAQTPIFAASDLLVFKMRCVSLGSAFEFKMDIIAVFESNRESW